MTTASKGSPEPGQSRISPFTNETLWRTDDSAPSRAAPALPSISIEESTPTISALGRATASVKVTRPEPHASSSTRRERTRASKRAKN
jgi:hypothetical protein